MSIARGQFYGRTAIIERIKQSLSSSQPDNFVLVGARLTGKSTLLRALRAAAAKVALVDCALLASRAELWQQLGLELHPVAGPGPQPACVDHQTADPLDPYARFVAALTQFQQQGQPILLLVDNFDQLLARCAEPDQLCSQFDLIASKVVMVLATTQPLYDVLPTLPAPLLSNTTQLFLGLLESEAADSWLTAYQAAWPGVAAMRSELLRLSGRHPFLLAKLGDSLTEIQQLVGNGAALGVEHLPLVQLRLAEHGRPLFLNLAQQLQSPASRHPTVAMAATLVEQMQRGTLRLEQVQPAQLPALNWLVNQALITVQFSAGELSYSLFSPLFAAFLSMQPTAPTVPAAAAAPTPNAGEWPIYDRLTKIEGALLRYFQQHSQALIPSEKLLSEVWRRPQASDRRVQEAIRRLRLQLEQYQPPIGEIRNERGRGYRFIPTANGQ